MEITKEIGKYVTIYIVVLASLVIIQERVVDRWSGYSGGDDYDDSYIEYDDASCNVAGVALQGTLLTYYVSEQIYYDDIVTSSENVVAALERAENQDNIDVIFLEIDSYGGSPAAAQEIVATLEQYVTKPVVAFIRGGGASSAYWSAVPADYIFALPASDVGSIGITMSYLDESILNQREGYTYNQISSGPFKDSGSPEKPLTPAERERFQRDVDLLFNMFVDDVARFRGLDREAVLALADGSSMLGEMAVEARLIDQVGSIYDALNYIDEVYGIDSEVCWQ